MPEPDPVRALGRLDRVLHEPARLVLLTLLEPAEEADFLYLHQRSGLTKGNLGAHLSRLEAAGYVAITKRFRGKVPHTTCRLTAEGRRAFHAYREEMRRGLALASHNVAPHLRVQES